MHETLKQSRVFRFDQMAVQVKDKVDPAEADVDRYVGLEHIEPDSLKLRRWGEPTDVESSKIIFKSGDIIFGKRRAYQRKLAVADFDGICSAHAMVLRSKTDAVHKEFLPFFMQSDIFMDRAVKISVGGLSPTINWGDLAREEFALPPLEDQRRIAEALHAAEQVSESHLALIAEIRIAQAATFREMLKAHNATSVPLGDLLTQSPRNGCSAPAASVPTGHWVLALSAISRWGYRADQLKPVERTPEMEAAIIAPGDLVVSRSNTREFVGLPACFEEDRKDVSYPDTMMRLSFDPSNVDIRFVELCLRSPHCRRQIQSYAAGTSASMKKINGTNLRKVEVPMIPITRQRDVLRQAGKMTILLRETENRIAHARSVKSSALEQSLAEVGASDDLQRS